MFQCSTDAEGEEIKSFYASVQEEIDHILKQDMLIIIGSWNVKIGSKAEPNVLKNGLGVEVGEGLIEFC